MKTMLCRSDSFSRFRLQRRRSAVKKKSCSRQRARGKSMLPFVISERLAFTARRSQGRSRCGPADIAAKRSSAQRRLYECNVLPAILNGRGLPETILITRQAAQYLVSSPKISSLKQPPRKRLPSQIFGQCVSHHERSLARTGCQSRRQKVFGEANLRLTHAHRLRSTPRCCLMSKSSAPRRRLPQLATAEIIFFTSPGLGTTDARNQGVARRGLPCRRGTLKGHFLVPHPGNDKFCWKPGAIGWAEGQRNLGERVGEHQRSRR